MKIYDTGETVVEIENIAGLIYHLEYNHYPPIKATKNAILICQKVIDRAIEAEITDDSSIYEEDIEMPNGETRTVGEIIENLHLEDFVWQGVGETQIDVEDE